jgi:hypothetical protein
VVAQRLLMGAVGTATVVAIGLLGRRVGGPVVGVVAAAVAAFYPMLFLSDAVLMAETPFLLLVTLALLLAYRAAAAPSAGRFVALGAVLGVSALTRAEGLVLAVVLVVPLAASLREQAWTRRVGLAAGAVVAAVALVVPWTVRNAVRLDAFVPISNNVGTAVDGANCDLAYSGDQLGLWRETFSQAGDQARELPQAEGCFEGFDVEAADFDEGDAASAHRRAGLEYARDHLGRVPAVMTVRALRTWGVFRPAQQIDFESLEGRPRRWQSVGTWMYWAILPAAVAGTVVLVRRRARVWPLLAPTVVVTATAALTYGQQRFRAAAEPSLVVLAAVALVHLGRRLAARQSPARSTPARS